MVLTRKHLMEYYSMTEDEVDAEIERLKKAKRHERLFIVNKPSDSDRIDTLVAMAKIPYYWVHGVGQHVTCNKGPVRDLF